MLSIIVPTFFRDDLLFYGLSSLYRQNISVPYEILVMNDGLREHADGVCAKFSALPIKCIFTGSRNTPNAIWRCPGYCINIGAKLAKGDLITLMGPEIWLDGIFYNQIIDAALKDTKRLVITQGIDDRKGGVLEQIKRGINNPAINVGGIYDLTTKFPFFLTLHKKEFIDIGGYDEEFTGFCWDDQDLVERLVANGCYYYKLPEVVFHLYHPRVRTGLEGRDKNWLYNQNQYLSKKGTIQRNVGRDWGVLK